MHPADRVLIEVQETYSEWLEYDEDGEMLKGILAALLAKERKISEKYKMSIKRMELM